MASPFFILGLPRSRTAWLAAFFSTWNVECAHDGLRYSETFSGLLQDLKESDAAYAGDSDSGLLFHWEELNELGAPVLFVHRRVSEVASSLKRELGFDLPPATVEKYNAAVDGLTTNTLNVSVSSLSDERVMQNVQDWLVPGIHWDPARWRLFKQLRITADMPAYVKEVQACRGAR